MNVTTVFIDPRVRKSAIGGISRVVEAQIKWLPKYDVGIVESPDLADVLALHAASWIEPNVRQRVVTHCHGLYWDDYKWDHWAHNVNAAVIDNLRRADAITVPSEWVANAVRRDTWANVRVIGHGVDIEEWQSLDTSNHGYVLWNKTREDSVCDPRVVSVLAAAMPNLKFVSTFGDEAPNVKIVGTLPYEDHKEYIQHASLYLCTPRETFGIGTLEAMACGVPVVGWAYGGQLDIIQNGVHGWLSQPGDYTDLVRGIEYCLDNRQAMGAACRELVKQKYQWLAIIQKYADLYDQLALVRNRSLGVHVSVIISSYNLKRFLQRSIESCLQQDYPKEAFEVIVVDDCSTDGSYELAKAMADSTPNVRVLRTKVNSNMPTVLNLGIKEAQGSYIIPLDADNMLAPGAIRVLADALDKSRAYDIVYGRAKFVTDDGATPDTRVAPDGISSWPPDIFNYSNQMDHKNQIPSTCMYRKKIWENSGGYRMRCSRIGEDPDFWCRTTTLGAKPAKVTDAVTLVYRMRSDSRSNTNQEWPWEKWYPNRGFMVGGPIRINEPTVSIIVPVGPGHGLQAIEDCLDSVYAQTYTNWECIVVDDCGDIRFLPSWVRRYSTNTPASGVSVARNVGLREAKGKFFVLLDADDYLDNKALEKMMAAWEPNHYVYCGWYKAETMEPYSIDNVYTPTTMLHNLIHPVTALYPMDIAKHLSFDETMRVGEDWDFVLGCMANELCGIYVDEPLLYYRQASGRNRQGLKDNIDEIRSQLNSKWSDRVMACGCTQKQAVRPTVEQMLAVANNDGDLVLVEYIGSSLGSITYTGPQTGKSYRFGLDSGNNYRYVHRADADHFIQRSEFQLATLVPA